MIFTLDFSGLEVVLTLVSDADLNHTDLLVEVPDLVCEFVDVGKLVFSNLFDLYIILSTYYCRASSMIHLEFL